MRRHLNTLYVTTEGAWVHKDGMNVVVECEGKILGRAPVHMLGGIICLGRVVVSPPLMGFCAEKGVSISFLTEYGRFLARVEGPISGNVLLRRTQYRMADDLAETALLVRSFVTAKLLNQRTVIRRALRDHGKEMDDGGRGALDKVQRRMTDTARRAGVETDSDRLRGIEGEASRAYLGVFNELIRSESPVFRFVRRSRRPPLDPVNALLSFFYSLLAHDCRSALEGSGLDPSVGFLHRDRPGRPGLALDLMEEFRSVLADRMVLSLINRRQIGENDFRRMENGATILRDDARKTLLAAWQERKRVEQIHPYLQEKASLGLAPHLQALLLARRLRGDLDAYPPFIWK